MRCLTARPRLAAGPGGRLEAGCACLWDFPRAPAGPRALRLLTGLRAAGWSLGVSLISVFSNWGAGRERKKRKYAHNPYGGPPPGLGHGEVTGPAGQEGSPVPPRDWPCFRARSPLSPSPYSSTCRAPWRQVGCPAVCLAFWAPMPSLTGGLLAPPWTGTSSSRAVLLG